MHLLKYNWIHLFHVFPVESTFFNTHRSPFVSCNHHSIHGYLYKRSLYRLSVIFLSSEFASIHKHYNKPVQTGSKTKHDLNLIASGSRCQNRDSLVPSPQAKCVLPVKCFDKSIVHLLYFSSLATLPANTNTHLNNGANNALLLTQNEYEKDRGVCLIK